MLTLDTARMKDNRGDISVQDVLVELPFLQDGCNNESSIRLVGSLFTTKTNF
jgi:E3 ubiquitin-protein ligase SHPRH